MSEYQYYEFAAIDKPLSTAQMATLRERSSRATITPNSFTNHYAWGDLKGDPLDWMHRYFDAYVYLANWCNCWLFLKVPGDVVDSRVLREYTTADAFTADSTKGDVILQWSLGESEDYDRFAQEDGSGWMVRLLPLRDEILRGDLRPLYLGWLAGVTCCEVDDDVAEPLPPPGLSRLTSAQQALVEFLDIDIDLVTVAGAGESKMPDGDWDATRQQAAWLEQWPEEERTAVLKLLLDGHGQQAERQMKGAFLSWQRSQRADARTDQPRRTVAQLWSLAEAAATVRQQAQAAKHKKVEQAQRAKRETFLRMLAANVELQWRSADKDAQRAVASGYDAALRTITDLSEAYALGKRTDFDRALAAFMRQHGTRTALVRRLVAAGLWRKAK